MGEGEDPESRENRGGAARLSAAPPQLGARIRERKRLRRLDAPPLSNAARFGVVPTQNKQLQRIVTRRRGDAASASFHYALAPRWIAQRATAQLRRYTSREP